MNFITFPVAATNIFPAANGKNGSQLITEWNLRSRDMVGTSSEITYEVGTSYVHSMSDFEVRTMSDAAGNVIDATTLEILPGRGVINGHFVQTLVSMSVNLVEANAELKKQAKPALKGKLAVGFRAFYATEETVAGSLLVENKDNMYIGFQTVILPEADFITPIDSPLDESKVTAHIKLATFNFSNNKISQVKNIEDKLTYVSADRIANIDMMLSDSYVKKTGLNPKRVYAFAGKGTDPKTGEDTWEDVTNSLMIWDNRAPEGDYYSTEKQPGMSTFQQGEDSVALVLAHQQVEGMTDADGNDLYITPKLISFPNADYGKSTPGAVSRNYTQQIKQIAAKINDFRSTLTGKQIMYKEELIIDEKLPPINSSWNIGDYILVNQDYNAYDNNQASRPPSTMYVVLPGQVLTIAYTGKSDKVESIPTSLKGCEIGRLVLSERNGDGVPGTESPETYPTFWAEGEKVRGRKDKQDYFVAEYTYFTDKDRKSEQTDYYYYEVATAMAYEWSPYVLVTGEINLATETSVGGFFNVSPNNLDYGYVYMDEAGRLRLVDYALLRTGTLAYQLSENITFPSGIDNNEIQAYLNNYVNDRIAFPTDDQRLAAAAEGKSPNVIDIFISLSEEESPSEININAIDSRFNTSVCLHFLGKATSTTTINIKDCEKVRIDNDIEGSPIINVYRSCVYYDPYVLNYIRTCPRNQDINSNFTGLQDIKLWYEMYDDADANLIVDNMTVSELDAPVIPEQIEYWKERGSFANDNHYLAALKSITFAGNGDIVGCGLLVGNNSTDNVDPGTKIVVGEFELPQGSGLAYPKSCMTRQLKVTGTFVSAYKSEGTWYVTDSLFSATTQVYDPYDMSSTSKGNIAFHSTTTLIDSDINKESIPAWDSGTFHIFYGGVIG